MGQPPGKPTGGGPPSTTTAIEAGSAPTMPGLAPLPPGSAPTSPGTGPITPSGPITPGSEPTLASVDSEGPERPRRRRSRAASTYRRGDRIDRFVVLEVLGAG